MGHRKISAFDVLYMAVRELYYDRVGSHGELPDYHIDFKVTEKFKRDKLFNEKFASVLNYVTAQVLLKMNCSEAEMDTRLSEIVEEQIHLIDVTVQQFPDGPQRRVKEKRV